MSQAGAEEPDAAVAAETAAVRLLAVREHTRFQLARKLRDRGHAAAVVDDVLDDLQSRDLLSDERFVDGYLQQRLRKGYGPLRIRAELAERGAPDGLIEQGLANADVDWQQLLEQVAERKFGGRGEIDRSALGKRGRHLQQRGFPISLVRRYLNSLHVI